MYTVSQPLSRMSPLGMCPGFILYLRILELSHGLPLCLTILISLPYSQHIKSTFIINELCDHGTEGKAGAAQYDPSNLI
jgi:hypothetical protein